MAEVIKRDANAVRIRGEVPADEVKARLAAAYAELARGLKYPGFRKGKVPRRILEKTYAGEVWRTVIDDLIPRAVERACEELGLEAVSAPRYDVPAAAADAPLTFVADVAVFPEVTLPDYEKFVVKRERPQVTDAEVDQAVENLRHLHARLEPVTERGALDGELVVLAFVAKAPPEGFSGKPIGVWASARADERFGRQVLGKKIGDVFDLAIEYPGDYPAKKFAGRTVKAAVEVTEIKKPVPPPLGDDFAKDMGEETLAALRSRVRARLEARAQELSYVRAYHRFLDDVLARAKVPLAASFVEEFIKPAPGEPPPGEKERAERLAAARRDLSRYFVVRALARREGVVVTADEVRAALSQSRADSEAESPAAAYDRILNEKLARKLIPREADAAAPAAAADAG